MEIRDLIQEAINRGICEEWAADFTKKPAVEHLCRKYFIGSDWAMEKDFPSVDALRAYRGQTERHGIYTDYTGTTTRPLCAFFGNSRVIMSAGHFDVKSIIVRHDSALEIDARGNAIVEVNVLDNARVKVRRSDNAQVTVYRYGGSVAGDCTLIEKSFKNGI